MTPEEIRQKGLDASVNPNRIMVLMYVEIAAQLAELNEKFTDYFQTLEPANTKRGAR